MKRKRLWLLPVIFLSLIFTGGQAKTAGQKTEKPKEKKIDLKAVEAALASQYQ